MILLSGPCRKVEENVPRIVLVVFSLKMLKILGSGKYLAFARKVLQIYKQKGGIERIYNLKEVPTNVHSEALSLVPSRINQNSLKTTSDGPKRSG